MDRFILDVSGVFLIFLIGVLGDFWVSFLLGLPAAVYFISMIKFNIVNRYFSGSWGSFFKSWYKGKGST